MKRPVFIVLLHFGAAVLASTAVYGVLALSGAAVPAWLLIGAVAFLAAAPLNTVASAAWERRLRR